ncbi:MAG: hypothetical protein IH820_15575 [Bacteroidetes bacterium]|nr:hypothetical protein [Bacteroidota bacterium]
MEIFSAITISYLDRPIEVIPRHFRLEGIEYELCHKIVKVATVDKPIVAFFDPRRPPAPDMSRMLSGHPESLQMPPPPALPEGPRLWIGAATNTAFAGPWGVTYAANLTPDSTTGLSRWTEDMFVTAMKTGKQGGIEVGRPILPPMPWPGYSKMSEEDLRAIYAYLLTVPSIRNEVPSYQPPSEDAP